MTRLQRFVHCYYLSLSCGGPADTIEEYRTVTIPRYEFRGAGTIEDYYKVGCEDAAGTKEEYHKLTSYSVCAMLPLEVQLVQSMNTAR